MEAEHAGMKIAITDAYTTNPGDLNWDCLTALGELEVHERLSVDEVIENCQDCEVLITNKVPFSDETFAALPQLRYLGILATGYNAIDLDAARKHNVAVCNVPAYSTDSVAQCAMAHILAFTNHVALHDRAVKDGTWSRSPDFSFSLAPIRELTGLTLGLIGFGDIAQAVARRAQAFGMHIIVNTRTERPTAGITFVDRDTLFTDADVISLHCPLNKDTEGLVSKQRLTQMKKDAIVINTGRGQLIDEDALNAALHEERIGGAGLDVLSQEPPPADHPLLSAPNCHITPHLAWASRTARARLIKEVCANLQAFLNGEQRNRVDLQK